MAMGVRLPDVPIDLRPFFFVIFLAVLACLQDRDIYVDR